LCNFSRKKEKKKNGRSGAIRLDYPIFGATTDDFHICTHPVAITLEVGHVPAGADHCVQPGKQKLNSELYMLWAKIYNNSQN
jgi:hypothetical protein